MSASLSRSIGAPDVQIRVVVVRVARHGLAGGVADAIGAEPASANARLTVSTSASVSWSLPPSLRPRARSATCLRRAMSSCHPRSVFATRSLSVSSISPFDFIACSSWSCVTSNWGASRRTGARPCLPFLPAGISGRWLRMRMQSRISPSYSVCVT
jgi:hypothetical protein